MNVTVFCSHRRDRNSGRRPAPVARSREGFYGADKLGFNITCADIAAFVANHWACMALIDRWGTQGAAHGRPKPWGVTLDPPTGRPGSRCPSSSI